GAHRVELEGVLELLVGGARLFAHDGATVLVVAENDGVLGAFDGGGERRVVGEVLTGVGVHDVDVAGRGAHDGDAALGAVPVDGGEGRHLMLVEVPLVAGDGLAVPLQLAGVG